MTRGDTPAIKGLCCPACGWTTLFLAPSGHITCGNANCKKPDYASALQRSVEQFDGRAAATSCRSTRTGW